MFTEKDLRKNPILIKAFMGVPADVFWQLIEDVEGKMPEYVCGLVNLQTQRWQAIKRKSSIWDGTPVGPLMVLRLPSSAGKAAVYRSGRRAPMDPT